MTEKITHNDPISRVSNEELMLVPVRAVFGSVESNMIRDFIICDARRPVKSPNKYESLSPTKWECKYHVMFFPKCRRKVLYEQLRRDLGEVFHQLARQKESRIEERHLMSDRVHMMIAIPAKYAVSQVIGHIKGKSAIHVARVYGERKGNFVGQHFWARGHFVSQVGRDEAVIRAYIRSQEQEEQRLDQLKLGG